MKVILIPSVTELCGVSIHVFNLAKLLNSYNLLDTVICPSDGWLSKKLYKENLPYKILEMSFRPTRFWNSSWKLFQYLRIKKSDRIVHLHGRFPTFTSVLSMVFLHKMKFVVTVHQFSKTGSAGLLGWKNWLELFILRHFTERISCVSEDLKKEVIIKLGFSYSYKVFKIKNWIYPIYQTHDIRYKRKKALQLGQNTKIVAMGRLCRVKGFDVLIDAIKIMVEEDFPILCDIYGDGPERENLIQQITKHCLENQIQLKGVFDKIRESLINYDLIVIPSRMESFGIVALEAYDAGVPVIASNIPGLRETVLSEKTGLLFESNNAKSLAGQVIRLIQSSTLYSYLVHEGIKFCKKFYPNQELFYEYLKFYQIKDNNLPPRK